MNKIKVDLKKNKADILFYSCFFAVLFIGLSLMNYCFPKTCDDITFSFISQPSIIRLLQSALMQGNGRLLGNFLCYLISFTGFVVFEKTVVWIGIIVLFILLVGSRNKLLNTVIAVVLIFPCDTVFSQVYAWNSGFQNYVVPVFIILFDMLIIKTVSKISMKYTKIIFGIILFVSAFSGQFFSENSSLFACCLALFFLLYCVRFKKSSSVYAVVYLIATFGGFVLMMSYPKILGTSEKIASYRQYADSLTSFFSLALKNFRLISKDFASYFLLWSILSFAFLLLINKAFEKSSYNRFIKIALKVSKLIISAYPVYSFFYSVIAENSITFLRYYFSNSVCIALIMYIIALLFVCTLLIMQKSLSEKDKAPIFIFMLSVASLVPLLVVSPIGSRTFYIIFVFMLLSGISILNKYINAVKMKHSLLNSICLLVMCSLLSVLLMAEFDNRYCNTIRNSYLATEIQAGNEEIVLPLLPHQNLVHDDTNTNTWKNYIKRKYNTDVELSFVDWNIWYETYYR